MRVISMLRKNWFVVGIIAALCSGALLAPFAEMINAGGWTNRVVVLVLFLITGFTLPTDRIKQDLASPWLHIIIQSWIFVLAPLLFLTSIPLFGEVMDGQLVYGILALSVLPTTVSSCIVFTQSSNGNTVAAVFNASIANTVGIFLSPLLLSLLLSSSGRGLPSAQLFATLRSLGINMLLPIVVGQIARSWFRAFADRNRKRFGVVSNSLILAVVLLAFSRTVANPDFSSHVRELPWVFVYLAAIHLVLVVSVVWFTRLTRFSRRDQITALFVAPQKTLALGAPLLTIYFSGQEVLGVALLPLIFYHPFQLLVASFIKSLPFVRDASEDVSKG